MDAARGNDYCQGKESGGARGGCVGERNQRRIPEAKETWQPDKRRDDFVSFVNDTWFVLQIRGENDKPNTIAFYKNMTRIISEYFKGSVLQEISPIDIQKYLAYLRTEYKSKLGSRFRQNHYVISTGRST